MFQEKQGEMGEGRWGLGGGNQTYQSNIGNHVPQVHKTVVKAVRALDLTPKASKANAPLSQAGWWFTRGMCGG